MRRELTDDRAVILAGYDSRIDSLRADIEVKTLALTDIMTEMSAVPERDVVETVTEERQLKDNSLSGFFTLLAGLTGREIDIIILIFAVMLGIALDLTGFSFVLVETAIETGKTAKLRAIRAVETMNETDETVFETINETYETGANKAKIISLNVKKIATYDDFAEYILDNNLDAESLTLKDFPALKKATFYRWKKEFRETDDRHSETK